MDKYKELEKRIKALEENQIKEIMTFRADTNVWRSIQRALTSNSLSIGSSATASPNASALLILNSVNKGVIFPRMTTTQRDAIVNPTEGMLIYNISTHTLQDYDGSNWANV